MDEFDTYWGWNLKVSFDLSGFWIFSIQVIFLLKVIYYIRRNFDSLDQNAQWKHGGLNYFKLIDNNDFFSQKVYDNILFDVLYRESSSIMERIIFWFWIIWCHYVIFTNRSLLYHVKEIFSILKLGWEDYWLLILNLNYWSLCFSIC